MMVRMLGPRGGAAIAEALKVNSTVSPSKSSVWSPAPPFAVWHRLSSVTPAVRRKGDGQVTLPAAMFRSHPQRLTEHTPGARRRRNPTFQSAEQHNGLGAADAALRMFGRRVEL